MAPIRCRNSCCIARSAACYRASFHACPFATLSIHLSEPQGEDCTGVGVVTKLPWLCETGEFRQDGIPRFSAVLIIISQLINNCGLYSLRCLYVALPLHRPFGRARRTAAGFSPGVRGHRKPFSHRRARACTQQSRGSCGQIRAARMVACSRFLHILVRVPSFSCFVSIAPVLRTRL
jgi:hypothetical protein